MKLPFFLFILFTFFTTNSIFAQKLLQIEKVGTLKVQRFYIGDEVVFQLEGETENYWYRERIQDIMVESKSVLFTNRLIKIADITKIRTFNNQGWSRGLSTNAFVASGGFVGLSLIASAVTEFMLSPATVILPGVTIIAALAIRIIFRRKTHRMGKRRRLRVLDLNFYKIGP